MRQVNKVACLKILFLISVIFLSACGTLGYYYQSAKGQLDLLTRREPIDDLLKDQSLDSEIRDRLELVRQIRQFASQQLHLPDNQSYTEYTDLKRPYALWNVFAAPELSTMPYEWCYPIVGCVVYRGYFDEAKARAYAATLTKKKLDSYVGGVPAYSTLGWFDDPVLNTILHYPDYELAGLIFHELAHQLVYVKGDSVFNESFASAIEIEGTERWLKSLNLPKQIQTYRLQRLRDQKVVELILSYRDRMQTMYETRISDEAKYQQKSQLLAKMKQDYQNLIEPWEGYKRYGQWFGQDLNNAHFVVISAYHDKVPAFLELLRRHDSNLISFYKSVIALSEQSAEDRNRFLDSLELPGN